VPEALEGEKVCEDAVLESQQWWIDGKSSSLIRDRGHPQNNARKGPVARKDCEGKIQNMRKKNSTHRPLTKVVRGKSAENRKG